MVEHTDASGGSSDSPDLESLLEKLRIITEGIEDNDQDMSARDVRTLKASLKKLYATSEHLTPAEIARGHEICKFMILDDMESCLTLWFGKSKETDDTIWREFSKDVTAASMGLYEHWSYAADQPHMIVALVLLLDQFRRNMYRGTPGMYACDAMCCSYVKRAMAANIHLKLTPKERIFLLLVLTHSEDVQDQIMCVSEYQKLEETLDQGDPLRVFSGIFQKHLDVVEKFDRFPHRNEIYQRENTPEEDTFLSDGAFRFDLPVRKDKNGNITFFRDGKKLWALASQLNRERNEPKLNAVVDSIVQERYKELYGGCKDGHHSSESTAHFLFTDPDCHRSAIEEQESVRIGDVAPDFCAKSSQGTISFHEYLGDSWGLLLSHPKDFTPVCTTELGRAAQLHDEFEKRNVKVVALSVDELKDHHKWVKDINRVNETEVKYPVVEDRVRKIAMKYGMLDQTTLDLSGNISVTIRSVFIINPAKKISLIMAYPIPCGRNFDEILRSIDALQTNWKYGVATPADWKPGKSVVVLPFYTDQEAEEKYSEIDKRTSYLRFAKDPGT